MATRTRKNLNMRVSEDWIRERREAMALCGCTNLSDWIRMMVEEGEAHALTQRVCAKYECDACGFWDSDTGGCTCSSLDKWYACPIESAKPENQQALKKYAEEVCKNE